MIQTDTIDDRRQLSTGELQAVVEVASNSEPEVEEAESETT